VAITLGTVAAIGFADLPPAQTLECYRDLGCRVVQAYRRQDGEVSVSQMRDAIAASGLPCDSLHGVFGEQFDPSSPDEAARQFAVSVFKSEGELVLELGGHLVVVHCSTIRQNGVSPEEHRARVSQLNKSIVELGRFGQVIGVKYAFENLPAYHPVGADVAELSNLLAELAAPNTGLCFDSGHANMVGSAADAVLQTRGQMLYLHFSDNSGRSDDHEMPTHGTLDTLAMAKSLHKIGYEGTMMLEVFYPPHRLRQLIDEGLGEKLARIVDAANGR
jgi:sugar phosphate isomerase/epimerase